MKDISNVKVLYLKGVLFILVGLLASIALLIEHPTLKTAVMLVIAVWAFARSYYFAFYVIENYADPGYKFSGLWSFVCYLRDKNRPGG